MKKHEGDSGPSVVRETIAALKKPRRAWALLVEDGIGLADVFWTRAGARRYAMPKAGDRVVQVIVKLAPRKRR